MFAARALERWKGNFCVGLLSGGRLAFVYDTFMLVHQHFRLTLARNNPQVALYTCTPTLYTNIARALRFAIDRMIRFKPSPR